MCRPTQSGLPFAKYSGAGNDFVVVEASEAAGRDLEALARRICSRAQGACADGLIVAEPAEPGRVVIRFFNPDGSEFGTCGNGSRCAALWAADHGHAPGGRVTLVTGDGPIESRVAGGTVALDYRIEARIARNLEVGVGGSTRSAWLVQIGTPHLVVPVERLPEGPIDELARPLRRHPSLGAPGANVDFLELRGDGRGAVRTFERGVEGETMACGSGAMACAVVAEANGDSGPRLVLRTRSGADLEVTLAPDEGGPTRSIRLAGPASALFDGHLREASGTEVGGRA